MATAVVTLLGVTNIIVVREGYLTALVTAFLIELAGAVIAIFKSANFFGDVEKPLNTEDDLRKSITKLDSAFGYLNRALKEQHIHFQSQLASAKHLAPTPETDTMVLIATIKGNVGNVPPEIINELLGVIADILEKKPHIRANLAPSLISLCKTLPAEYAGESSRILHLLENKA